MKSADDKTKIRIQNRALHLLKEGTAICILAYLGFGAMLFIFQSRFIYYPDKTSFEDCPAFENAEKISFGSSRGYFTERSPEKAIVFYHGNAGRACDRDYLGSLFSEHDYSTFFVEYSGYGEEGNNPSMRKLLKNTDDTIGWLKTKNFKEITVIGESVGVGPAAYHAGHSHVDNLILVTAYNNLAEVAFSHYPVYPVRLLLLNNFTPDTWLLKYEGPVSVILADNDEIIPNRFGRKLYDSIHSELKKIYVVENASHNTIYEKEDFYYSLEESLRQP